MSPEPNPLKLPTSKTNEKYPLTISEINMNATTDFESRTCQPNDKQQTKIGVNSSAIISAEFQECSDVLIKPPAVLAAREKKMFSPSSCILYESYVDPHSPSSSSSTSQATNDATFEPTIEMMVNDFDDEQTLNEEEALASLESQDPEDEINTLKKESEMPLEELLAKYRDLPHLSPSSHYPEPLRIKPKKISHKEKNRQKKNQNAHSAHTSNKISDKSLASNKICDNEKHAKANLENFQAESDNGSNLVDNQKEGDIEEKCSSMLPLRKSFTPLANVQKEVNGANSNIHSEMSKVRRSHLFDLYPEGTFHNVVVVSDAIAGSSKDIPLDTLFGVEDDEEVEEDDDEDYKKKVMIGASYQATIPVGLSLYGDILPYENEDKLIWEPCQVSEREVEEYLIKIRDIKSNLQGEDEEISAIETNMENQSKENGRSENKIEDLENNSFFANGNTEFAESATTMETDSQAVVKDNEQALHLLVQCGYDFKEALRRKRLNALPLNDCMSLWSEEECHKFEEGIQKYGKDFLKIRQNQVRTRTMRELVQFYYLWKKSERRDHNFANADTVDHMDIYLNEDNEYGSNPSAVLTPVGSPDANTSNCTGTGRNSNFSQKNISIMTTTSAVQAAINLTSEKNGSNPCLHQHHHQQQQHKRRTHSYNQTTLNNQSINQSIDIGSENLSNTFSNSK